MKHYKVSQDQLEQFYKIDNLKWIWGKLHQEYSRPIAQYWFNAEICVNYGVNLFENKIN